MERALKQFEGLRSYFLSESCEQARFIRLQNVFGKPISEVYLLFYQAVFPVFNSFNKFLQREDPCIHLVHDQCMSLLKKVIGKFIKIDVIRDASSYVDVDLDTSNQLADANLFIGFITRQKLLKLEREGDVSSSETRKFLRVYGSFMNVLLITLSQNFPLMMTS